MRPRSPRRCYRRACQTVFALAPSSQKGAPGKEHLSGPCLVSRATRPESSREFRCAELEPCDLATYGGRRGPFHPGLAHQARTGDPGALEAFVGTGYEPVWRLCAHTRRRAEPPTIPRRRPSSGPLAPYRSSGRVLSANLAAGHRTPRPASTNIGARPAAATRCCRPRRPARTSADPSAEIALTDLVGPSTWTGAPHSCLPRCSALLRRSRSGV